MLRTLIATGCLVWFVVVWAVCAIGFTQLLRYNWNRPQPATCLTELEEEELPHVTVIRPVKGLEPCLYECLAASLRQTYPKSRIDTVFCVSARSDPAFPTLQRLCQDFGDVNVRILVEDEDPLLLQNKHALGPNPKIRNMSRAYREATGDIVWILDCNVWVGKGVCGRMVDLLCGYKDSGRGSRKMYKFVHQTPIAVDMDDQSMTVQERQQLLGGRLSEDDNDDDDNNNNNNDDDDDDDDDSNNNNSLLRRILQRGGGRLDEAFMSSSHAKFYNAINTVAIAPCIIGKSTMFRRSQLNYITSSNPERAPGIDFFSDNICEDHLIGDALWKQPQAFEQPGAHAAPNISWGKHAMLFGDFCFQPISHTSIAQYLSRRIRWLRVRKFTVPLATLVEPGTESLVCSLYGAYALTTLPIFFSRLNLPPTWPCFALVFLANMSTWCLVDAIQYLVLHCAKTVEIDSNTPHFIIPNHSRILYPLKSRRRRPRLHPSLMHGARRGVCEFLIAWAGRELSALPVWVVAFWGGVGVEWRGRRFWVGWDMRVHEVLEKGGGKVSK